MCQHTLLTSRSEACKSSSSQSRWRQMERTISRTLLYSLWPRRTKEHLQKVQLDPQLVLSKNWRLRRKLEFRLLRTTTQALQLRLPCTAAPRPPWVLSTEIAAIWLPSRLSFIQWDSAPKRPATLSFPAASPISKDIWTILKQRTNTSSQSQSSHLDPLRWKINRCITHTRSNRQCRSNNSISNSNLSTVELRQLMQPMKLTRSCKQLPRHKEISLAASTPCTILFSHPKWSQAPKSLAKEIVRSTSRMFKHIYTISSFKMRLLRPVIAIAVGVSRSVTRAAHLPLMAQAPSFPT